MPDAGQATPADNEIVTSRLLDAPVALVWQAWTQPEHIALWWGPNGFTNTIHEMTVRPGGVWRFMMHGPDGTDYPNRIVFSEVVKHERLVYSHGGGDADAPPDFHVTTTFEAQGAQTLLTMRAAFPSAALRDQVVREFGALDGAKQTVDRLEAYLAAGRVTTA